MQIVHLVIIVLNNQSLQNHVMGCWLWQKSLPIGRTKILFAFIYKQSMLTSSGCYVTITETVPVNKYDQELLSHQTDKPERLRVVLHTQLLTDLAGLVMCPGR